MDFDNDGWKDLFFANGHFPRLEMYLGARSELAPSVFRNLGGKGFQDVSRTAGLIEATQQRGTAFADFNNDGLLDVAVSVLGGPARLYMNRTAGTGAWIAFLLQGGRSNRDGLGAVIELTLKDGRRLWNHATTSVGYASSSERLVRFGLGAGGSVDKAVVRWPGGASQTIEKPAANRVARITEQSR